MLEQRMRIGSTLSFLAICLIALPAGAQGDPAHDVQQAWEQRFRFEEYQLLHGTFVGRQRADVEGEDGRRYVVFETPAGGLLKLDVGRVVKEIREVNPLLAEYIQRVDAMDPDSAEAHFAIASWIRAENATVKLSHQYEFHLQETVRLDPDQETAWKLLDYDNFNGVWQRPENKFEAHGYVRDVDGWMPRLAYSRKETGEVRDDQFAEQRDSLRQWKKTINRASPAEVAASLKSIVTPALVPEILKLAMDADNPTLRAIYVEALGEVHSMTAQHALVYFAIRDPDRSISDRAITLLKQPHFSQSAAAAKIASDYLASPLRSDVLRGAFVLGELEQTNAILPLISALNTTHQVANPNGGDPGRLNSSFSSDGSLSGFSQNNAPKVVPRSFSNDEVLSTLRRLTDVNFGYDEAAWKAWYSSHQTVQVTDLRAGG